METKVILITGAAAGMGKATTIHLAKIGYKNFALVDQNEENLKIVAKECEQLGAAKVCILLKDLAEPYSVCKEIIEETIKEFKQINVLISNAGIVGDVNNTKSLNENALSKIINVNLIASMTLTKYALPYLAESKGCILYTSSIACKLL